MHLDLTYRFKHFDNTYIRPCLIRDLKGAEPKILETFSKLTMKDAMDMMNRNPTGAPGKINPDSVAAILRSNMNGQGGRYAKIDFNITILTFSWLHNFRAVIILESASWRSYFEE